MPNPKVTLSLVERLRKWHTPGETITGDVQLYLDAADEIDRLTRERDAMSDALEDIAIYGCGMLNQPAAMNGPEDAWLRKRISEYERRARSALNTAAQAQGE